MERLRHSAALLLAGGFSRRMGVDKASLRWKGTTLLHARVEAASAVCEHVLVLARAEQDLPAWPDAGASVLRLDDSPRAEGEGPLMAVVRGLHRAAELGAQLACIGACDMPWLDAPHFRFVLERLARGPEDAVLPRDTGDVEVFHPLAGAVRIAPAVALGESLLHAGQRAMVRLYLGLSVALVESEALPDPRALRGCNTPAQWAEWNAAVALEPAPRRR